MDCQCAPYLYQLIQSITRLELQNKHILKEIKKMALDQTKLQAGVDRIAAGVVELTQEFKDLNDKINLPNPEDQKAVDAFGDKLLTLGQALSDISPNTPNPPASLRSTGKR